MFSGGLIPPTDISHDLSNCIDGLGLVPQFISFTVITLTLCGTTYQLDTIFSSQSELLDFLNENFNDVYEYSGTWSIISNHLIYSSEENCEGTNCVSISNTQTITEIDGGDAFTNYTSLYDVDGGDSITIFPNQINP